MFRLFSTIVVCTALAACAAPPKQQVQKPLSKIEEAPQPETEERFDLASIIDDYKLSSEQSSLKALTANQQTQEQLIELADKHLKQNDCYSANTIIKYSLKLPLSEDKLAKANIIRSECLVIKALENQVSIKHGLNSTHEQLTFWLSSIDEATLNAQWQQRYTMLNAFRLSLEADYQRAIEIVMTQSSSSSTLSLQTEAWLFSWLGQVPAAERIVLVDNYPNLFEYQTLLSIIEDDSIKDTQKQAQLRDNLALIQQRNPAFLIPPQIAQYVAIELKENQNIAVLLPLSGRLEGQGQAIKQGILAGYYAELFSPQNAAFGMAIATTEVPQDKVNLTFIDTGSEDQLPETINAESLSRYSTVIGPLLKSHIPQVQSLGSAQTLFIHLNHFDSEITSKINLEDSLHPQALNNYFALSPEQEAQQIVVKMLEQNILHPVLIHDNSALSSRMADAFLDAWQALQQSDDVMPPSKVSYADNKSMRVGITSALDVLQSQQRINQMSNLVNEKVYSVTRNRRDVDAFVVFARPNELELINPIIESSMSLFTNEQIPVFATSFSYNHKQNRNSLRDLRSLVFVDMPFVLPEGRDSQIAQQVDTLFNEPSSTFLRLFAFGYDAIDLTQQALKLRIFDYSDAQGLSGRLNINREGKVTRELSTLAIQAGD